MNRREFLMSTLAAFALSALPKLTLAETVAVTDAVRARINPNNKLGFGFMRLPLKDPKDQTSIDYATLNKMVDMFLERGFSYFDTAWMYMGYESEVALREALVKRHPRDKFTVASKLPVGYLSSKEQQEDIFNKQLEKTGLSYFDYYLIHNVNANTIGKARQYDSLFKTRKKKERLNISAFLFMILRSCWKRYCESIRKLNSCSFKLIILIGTMPVFRAAGVMRLLKNTENRLL